VAPISLLLQLLFVFCCKRKGPGVAAAMRLTHGRPTVPAAQLQATDSIRCLPRTQAGRFSLSLVTDWAAVRVNYLHGCLCRRHPASCCTGAAALTRRGPGAYDFVNEFFMQSLTWSSAAPLCRTVTLSADAHFSGPAWSLGRAPTRRPRASRIPATVGP
jgi:hypothetical protein